MGHDKRREILASAFCENFKDFLKDLRILYPDDSKLKYYFIAFNGAVLTNKENVVLQTMEYISPYANQILEKNEDFFLKKIHVEYQDNSWISDEMGRIREIWLDKDTKESTKEIIWKYFSNFIKIWEMLN